MCPIVVSRSERPTASSNRLPAPRRSTASRDIPRSFAWRATLVRYSSLQPGLADADDGGRAFRYRGSRQKVTLERVAARPGNHDDLTRRLAVPQIFGGAFAYACDCDLVIGVGWIENTGRRPIVVDRAQPVAPCGKHMAVAKRDIAAVMTGICDRLPFPVPGILVGKIDAIRSDPTFRKRRASLLSCGEEPLELGRQVFPFGQKDRSRRSTSNSMQWIFKTLSCQLTLINQPGARNCRSAHSRPSFARRRQAIKTSKSHHRVPRPHAAADASNVAGAREAAGHRPFPNHATAACLIFTLSRS
jgi:hypothetical protein